MHTNVDTSGWDCLASVKISTNIERKLFTALCAYVFQVAGKWVDMVLLFQSENV